MQMKFKLRQLLMIIVALRNRMWVGVQKERQAQEKSRQELKQAFDSLNDAIRKALAHSQPNLPLP